MTPPATIWSATAGPQDGTHVVLIHGSLDRSAGMLKLSRRLDDEMGVTRYDRRGYGRSSPHPGPFDIDGQVDDLDAVVGRIDGDGRPLVLVGHSYGGNVALSFVDRHPGRVAAVVTYESPMSWEPWWPQDSAGGNAMAWSDDPEEAAERFMRRLIGDDRWERLPPATRTARRREGAAMIGELSDLRRRAPWRPERIDVPVLVLRGEHGQAHHRLGTDALAAALPDATARTIPGARHFGPNTHPDEVGELVREFVATMPSSS
ncbi:MAG: alpha/beta fold hydrolase [Acidimicrobiia bacterium]